MQPDKNKNKDKSHKSHYLQGLVLGPMWKHEVQRGDIYDICTDDDDEVLNLSKKIFKHLFCIFQHLQVTRPAAENWAKLSNF